MLSRSLPKAIWVMVCVLALYVFPAGGFAQTNHLVPTHAATDKSAEKTEISKPTWAELTAKQQQALKPLAVSWNTISETQKRKWLEISKNYPTLSPTDQVTLHSRMVEWVALSPQQRTQARLNFAKAKELSTQLTSEEKKAKWELYQALSVQEKQALASKATPRPVGAAVAVKPVATQKLTETVPRDAKSDTKSAPKHVPVQGAAITPHHAGEAVPASLATTPKN